MIKLTKIKLLASLILAILFSITCSSPTTATGGDDGNGGNPTNPCMDNPFGSTCGDDFLQARVNDCITAGNASETRCEAIFTEDSASANTCLVNPFTDACKTDTAFITYTETARTNRVNFCASDSTGSLLCTALTTCQNNPFDASCGEYFAEAKIRHCATTPACTDGVITHADWVEGFDTPPNTAGDYTREVRHEFLQGTEVGLVFGTVKDILAPRLYSFTLEPLGGEAKNGVAWFFGGDGATGASGPVRLYSGIFSGTNLGAPLVSADVSVSVPWAGNIGWRFFDTASTSTSATGNNLVFDLTVDFANSEIRAFVARGGAPAGNTDHFLLKATFDDRGRLDGTIKHGAFAGNDKDATPTNVTNGVLTGLIGELGAVGVFISDKADIATTDTAFVGGFVAISPKEVARIEQERLEEAQELLESQVTYTDWIGGFGVSPPPATPTSPATNQFLAGTTTLDPLTSITPLTLTSTIGGVGFFTENGAFYAGLLSNTNLGLPVAITPQASGADVMATWPGKIRAIQVFDGSSTDTTTALDLNVVVNLTARTFTGTVVDPNASTTSIIINGLFPAINNGVVTGTVTQRANVFTRNGQLTGIIGQDGVVGAFYSDSNVAVVNRYVGGFVAKPSE